jgi:hypothetical protein
VQKTGLFFCVDDDVVFLKEFKESKERKLCWAPVQVPFKHITSLKHWVFTEEEHRFRSGVLPR